MYELSNVTKDYLACYYKDLEEMIDGMEEVSLTDSISHNFIQQMIPHHMMAIHMCNNFLKYTTNISLQKMAFSIIEEQEKSISDMEEILSECAELESKEKDLELYQMAFDHITDVMFSEMKTACVSNNINVDFMREMLPHHKGAIHMCKNVLCYPICDELKSIICSIIRMQEEGIEELKYLLRCI